MSAYENTAPLAYEEYLRRTIVDQKTIDAFLDHEQPTWAQFDPTIGYRLGNSFPRDGIDGSHTISTTQHDGIRKSYAYCSKPCRLNTYGDSFTQCTQVSDGETWQEYLGAHLGEPIRNFGVGGYGVYQTYRRMIREERSESGAEYMIFYAWGDDHIRSLLRCRHAAIYPWYDNSGFAFHCNFWANIEMNLATGELDEHENRLPTPQSVYRMTDAEWMVDALKDDLALRLYTYASGAVNDLDVAAIRKLAHHLNFELDLEAQDSADPHGRVLVKRLLDRYSFAATKLIFTKAREFAEQHQKKLLIVLFDPYRVLEALVEGKPRYDEEIVEFLQNSDFHFFDMNLIHAKDYESFRIPFTKYLERYFIGHYNSAGNHFFASSLRSTIVDWLDPKPITYRTVEDRGSAKSR